MVLVSYQTQVSVGDWNTFAPSPDSGADSISRTVLSVFVTFVFIEGSGIKHILTHLSYMV